MKLGSLCMGVVLACAILFGCTPATDPGPAPATSAQAQAVVPPAPHRLGVSVNSASDVGQLVVEAAPLVDFFKSAADGSAATATAETAIGQLGPGPKNVSIGSCYYTPAAALTADDTNFATINVFKRTAGGATSTLASATTKTVVGTGTGNWTAWAPISLPPTAGVFLTPGDAITFSITKGGSGVVVPQGMLACYTKLE